MAIHVYYLDIHGLKWYKKPMSMYFPDISEANEDGLLAQGGLFESELLLDAYANGIFPWPMGEGEPILWFAPPLRGVLFFNELHTPKRFKSWYKKHPYQITFNQAFTDVMAECAKAPRAGQQGTWITKAMIRGYSRLFGQGYGLSCEIWDGDDLVGGLYGVMVNGHFSGESMFKKRDNASKLALVETVNHLKSQGLSWMDTQMTTEVIAQFGGREIPRDAFMEML